MLGVNLSEHLLGNRALFDHHAKPHLVTIGKGKTATAILGIVETGNFSPSLCHTVTAAGLKVYPPNQTRAKLVPFPFGACSSTSVNYLNVQLVK